jgi:hypothetical protein
MNESTQSNFFHEVKWDEEKNYPLRAACSQRLSITESE